jgi:preprotein translocase subunit YajC
MQSTSLFPTFIAQDAAPGGGLGGLGMMVIMFLVMYFLIIRPQRRQQKEHQARVAGLKTGDKIVTAGGIYGSITNVKDKTVIVRIADNVRIELAKSSVATVLTAAERAENAEVESTGS